MILFVALILSIPPSLEPNRTWIEEQARGAAERVEGLCGIHTIARTITKCFRKKTEAKEKRCIDKKVTKALRKCKRKVSKIRWTCEDAFEVRCNGPHFRGCSWGKKAVAACRWDDLENIWVHEGCHTVAGSKSGHSKPECAR